MLDYNPIIVALDGMDLAQSLNLAERLTGEVGFSKANTLLRQEGYSLIEKFKGQGFFADLKLHDIPNTVANDVKSLAALPTPPDFITVMASGGIDMMGAAVDAAGDKIKILAVTVLTSLTEEDAHLMYGCLSKVAVLRMARDAKLAGVHGIVCSPKELPIFQKRRELKGLIKVTPGIRPKWYLNPNDDQSRVTTPADAIKMGADYLVIGRPIYDHDDPAEAAKLTLAECEEAFADKAA